MPLMEKHLERHALRCIALHRSPTFESIRLMDLRLHRPARRCTEQPAPHRPRDEEGAASSRTFITARACLEAADAADTQGFVSMPLGNDQGRGSKLLCREPQKQTEDPERLRLRQNRCDEAAHVCRRKARRQLVS